MSNAYAVTINGCNLWVQSADCRHSVHFIFSGAVGELELRESIAIFEAGAAACRKLLGEVSP